MLAGLNSWRGTLEVEVDKIYLRDGRGAPNDIQDLFLATDAIASVSSQTTEVGGGLPPQVTLTWPDDPTDDQVPGLKSLLDYLAEERPTTNNFYISQIRNFQPVMEQSTFLTRRVDKKHGF